MRGLLLATLLSLALLAGCAEPVAPDVSMVAVTATWCQPCKNDKPLLHEVSGEFAVRVVDYDAERAVVNEYGVTSVPTYIVFDAEGKEVGRSHSLLWALNMLRTLRKQLN